MGITPVLEYRKSTPCLSKWVANEWCMVCTVATGLILLKVFVSRRNLIEITSCLTD